MVRVLCCLEIRHVTGSAVGRRPSKLAINMTLGTGDVDVSAGQGKLRQRVVIELRSCPLCSRVAALAGGGEPGGGVARIRRIPEICHVARGAIGGRAFELAVHMTLAAGDGDVCTGERELSECVVIELGTSPACGGVARTAFAWEAGRDVVRIGRCVVVLGVAGVAGSAGALELSANVAGHAVEAGVRSGKCEAGKPRVVELGSAPTIEGMAIGTGGTEAQRDVVWILGGPELSYVAGRAICRETLELSGCGGLVA